MTWLDMTWHMVWHNNKYYIKWQSMPWHDMAYDMLDITYDIIYDMRHETGDVRHDIDIEWQDMPWQNIKQHTI